ncbi:MAG: hypothetical protein M0Z30_07625 [Actinomycetota bacterium]|nr:hypothetical protein [Actinomycetota bacterium]
MSAPNPVTVVVDPMDDLAETLVRIQDYLHFADPGSDEAETTLMLGARAAAVLAGALRRSGERSPTLRTPDGLVELAPLLVVPGHLPLAALRRALDEADDPGRPGAAESVIDLLERCAAPARRRDAAVLAAEAGLGRGSVRLSITAYRCYRRHVEAVILDPLERFAAVGPDPGAGGVRFEDPTGAEIEL